MRFEALKNFADMELRSSYEKGQRYTIREGNTLLADKVEVWVTEGKVKKLRVDGTPEAQVAGKGEVK